MRWSPKQAVRSASLALSRAAWLGIDRNEAIQAVLEVAEFPHFQANPHILFETWATVSEQLGSPDQFELRVASASVRDGISAAAVVFAPDYGSEDDHQIRSHIYSRDCAGSTSPDRLASAA